MKKPIRIAIADDQEGVRELIVEYLNKHPDLTVVCQASNGQLLLDKLQSIPQTPHICLLDISMPVLNGLDTLKVIRSKWTAIKNVILSMYITDDNVKRAFLAGANAVVSKDEPAATLVNAIRKVFHNGVYESESAFESVIRAAQQKTLQVPNITEQEMTFIKLCCNDISYKEIADEMKLSVRTVHGYRDALCKKLGVKGREGIMMYAFKSGLIV